MNIKKHISLLLLVLSCTFAWAQNTLTVGSLSGGQGKDVMIPISMDNADEIVALQFNLQLPFIKSSRDVELTSRNVNGHTVAVRSLGSNKYTVVVVNMSNKPLGGSGGTLLNFPMTVPTGLAPGAVYDIVIDEVVMTNRQGDNIQTGSTNGTYTIQRDASPDLEVSDVKLDKTELAPGETVTFSWKVSNIGTDDTHSGWTEKLYLVSTQTEEAVYLSSCYYSNNLLKGGYTVRNYALTIPKTVGLEDNVVPKVVLEPNSSTGEYTTDRLNNTALGDAATLSKNLFLSAPAVSLKEGESMRLTLTRSGDRSADETFNVVTSLPGHVTLPSAVTIRSGYSSAYFDVACPDNNTVNDYTNAIVTVQKAHGYPADAAVGFDIEDNELIPLSIALDKSEYNEGDIMQLTASVAYRVNDDPITINLSVEKGKRFRLPQTAVIPAGQTSVTVQIPVVQDNVPANDETLSISVSAEHYLPASKLFILHDDDVPAITMTMQPTDISEAAGYNAVYATIKRVEATNSKITLKLSDNSNGELYYTTPLTMDEGVQELTFPIGVRDNQKVDGTRTVKFNAAVYITDCGCSAIGEKQTSVSETITINDNDGPTLSVSSNRTTILEGDASGAVLTISRNADTSLPLTVQLSANGSDLSYASEVTIPAGEESVTTTFKALSNATTEGNRTVSVKANAEGYSQGSVWMLISDQTLADAEMQSPVFDAEVIAGSQMRIKIDVKSIGAIAVPAGTTIKVSVGNSYTTVQTDEDIAPGNSQTVYADITAPTVPGSYIVTVQINPDGKLTELQTLNNSVKSPVSVKSAYSYTMATDKANYLIGETVKLTGTVLGTDGLPAAGVETEPYIIYAASRTKLSATTDAEGKFAIDYAVPAGMGGAFGYGVCTPGEDNREEMGNFGVYGFCRTTTDYITNKLYLDEPFVGIIKLKNMGNLPITNILGSCSDAGSYEVAVEPISKLPANGTVDVRYTLTPRALSPSKAWDLVTLHFASAEGAVLDVVTYNYTQKHTPTLVVETTNINTTVTKGKPLIYPLNITNTGLAETGKITVSLPSGLSDFISLATPKKMPSIATGDSATIMLKFNAGDDYALNVIQKGSIAINCEDGDGKAVYFNVKVVSDEKGSLKVRVADENTDLGNGYLKNATVKLTDYNTGALVVQDVTGEDGSLTISDVQAGYYRLYVTADKHDSYTQNVMISPGLTTEHVAYVSYQAISVSWEVEETEVDDEYEIVTKLTYETQVPVPVVEMTAPDTLLLENIQPGQTALINAVLRNRGLITAQEVNFSPPTARGFVFMPMVEYTGFSLAPEQSYIIPILVMHAEDYENESFAKGMKRVVMKKAPEGEGPNCNGKFGAEYKWPCGEGSKFSWLEKPIQLASNISCSDGRSDVPVAVGTGSGGFGPPDPSGSGSLVIKEGGDKIVAALIKLACTICECMCNDPVSNVPCGGAAINGIFGGSVAESSESCANDLIENSLDKKTNGAYGKAKGHLDCAEKIMEAKASPGVKKTASTTNSLLAASGFKLNVYYTILGTILDYNCELTGAREALEQGNYSEMAAALSDVDYVLENMKKDGSLWNFDLSTIPATTEVEDRSEGVGPYLTSLMPSKRANVFDFSLRSYVERIRNKWRKDAGMEYDSENYPDENKLKEIRDKHDECVAKMVDYGCATIDDLMQSARRDWLEYQEKQSENTCAEIKLEISQKLVLTRQAFRGTLTIDNGSENNLSNINVHVDATNMETGAISTSHEMQISVESIEGFEGDINGAWSLPAGKKGVATYLFIPTKYAAPENLTTYSFGGTLSLNDGSTEVSRTLYPVSLQVKPSPELDLTYFMQRDIYGDNPLTPDVVEPVVPSEFSVLIHNKGNGDANNVRMITQKPRIVENEKGLMVDFDIVSSSLNGGEKSLALEDDIATMFGTIGAGKSAYATWDLTSSLLGHFTEYNVSFTHVTDYGNPDLSLLDKVTIHELIHSINARIGDETYRAWITNDFEDGHDEPDHIYFSNGTDEDIAMLKDVTEIVKVDESKYRITVTVPQKQWFYTSVANPAGKYAKILSITDETAGKAMDPENFWTTEYTMQDGADPILDYRLHIADLSSGPETRSYLVEFEPMPEVRLAVDGIGVVPAENEIAETPINELTVRFNKAIKPETFTRNDIVLRHEGKTINTDLPIKADEESGNTTFKLNTSALSENGYYSLQVKSDNITDSEGYTGGEGYMVRWMLYKDGLVHYNFKVQPFSSYGTISIAEAGAKGVRPVAKANGGTVSGSSAYGNMITITATPEPGYKFMYWKNNEDDEILSYEQSMTIEACRTLDVSAVFAPESYNVTINNNADNGTLDVATGIYEYGTQLTLNAVANDGYRLDGYKINGTMHATTEPYVLTVEGETVVEVVYTDLTPQSVLLTEGTDYTPADIDNAKVSFYRTFVKDVWNTLCLPCPVESPEKVFGEGTKVAKLTSVNGTTLMFSKVTSMEANVPYLIKPGVIHTAAYAGTATPTILYDLGTSYTAVPLAEKPMTTVDNVSYIGTYKVEQIPSADGNYYISSNMIYYIDEAATVNTGRFRGYFHNSEQSAAKMYISFDEATELPIPIYIESVQADVYNASGVMVRKAGDSLRGLKPGIYITHDRKIVVK